MFEIPFNFIFINPALDILLLISFFYYFIFILYKKLLVTKPEKIIWIDMEISAIFLLLGYLNYSEKTIDFFGFKMDWWFYVILAQLFIEGVYVFLNWGEAKEYLKIIKRTSLEKEKDYLKKSIVEMKMIKNMLEEELNKYNMQGNNDAVKKTKSDIEKISVTIDELEDDLKELSKEIK